MRSILVACSLLLALATTGPDSGSGFASAVATAERALAAKDLPAARSAVERALERDPKSTQAWALRAKVAESAGDQDELVFSLHRQLRLAVAQKQPKEALDLLRARLVALDPVASDLLALPANFVAKLEPIAKQYEKDKRPHSAIRVHKQILALDPERASSHLAIETLAAARDPSLAEDAKPRDLLEGVSKEWIAEHDVAHTEWSDRAKLERDSYVTMTNAGYECLVRCSEAMEQMNAFYRQFFRYGGKSTPRIDIRIFKSRDEYLKLGEGPPVEWSGGHFTGGAVETYVGDSGFQGMVGTLFHEAAHQFVSLATNASGWLNEGLASFFEGSRILPNGAVVMNEPADHRLFPLVERMKVGWMSSHSDGIEPGNPESNPTRAPTFRIVLESEYEWGPPWYAPTWGVVYFLYNYQDPIDGRFVFRSGFQDFIDASAGKIGKGAIETFEKVVLAEPKPPIKGVKRPSGAADVALPKTVDELDAVWKSWLVALADERSGKQGELRPYLGWARAAVVDKDPVTAQEHFEKGLAATPDDVELLIEFAGFLAEQKNPDLASKLALRAARLLEQRPDPDKQRLERVDRLLDKTDPKRTSLERVRVELAAAGKGLVARYQSASMPLMVMDLSWRLALDYDLVELLADYSAAVKTSKKSLSIWELAYNEDDLKGWAAAGDSGFVPDGVNLNARFGEYAPDKFDYRILTLDRLTAGDFSIEAEVQAERGKTAFCGLVFGRKGLQDFHALIVFPGTDKEGSAGSGFVDLASAYGGVFKTWRHSPVETAAKAGETTSDRWHALRVDVSGTLVDTWFDGEFLSTQDFPSRDVLRGSFGLILGAGEARFRNVRFLALDPRDQAAKLEREVRVAPFQNAEGPVGGSYLGKVPPFPEVKTWVQGKRTSWEESGAVPQLLVLWSIAQNDLIPIDAWLTDLQQRTRNIGLEIVCIASSEDDDKPAEYVPTKQFPGAVAIDLREKPGMGETFIAYSLERFNLPRLILLDVDGKVVWEGDPGFTIGSTWSSGQGTFLDTPLAELAAKRNLEQLVQWRKGWPEAKARLSAGEVAKAAEVLLRARGFAPGSGAEVTEAQQRLASLDSALASPEATATSFAREGCEPALPILIEWAKLLGKPVEPKAMTKLKPTLDSKSAKAWPKVAEAIESWRKKSKKAPGAEVDQEFLGKLEALPGRFPRELAAELRAAFEKQDAAAVAELMESAAARPTRWLVRDYLRW